MISRKNITPHDVYIRFTTLFFSTLSLFLSFVIYTLKISVPWIGNIWVLFFAFFFWGYYILLIDIFLYYFGEFIKNFIKKSFSFAYQFYKKYEIWGNIVILFIGYFCFMALTRYIFMGHEHYLESVFQIGQLGFLAFISFVAKEIYDEYKKKKRQLKVD